MEQGFIASIGKNNTFSEAVIVHFNSKIISVKELIEIHLYSHKSTSNHSMRYKYRSAVYTFSAFQKEEVNTILRNLQSEFDNPIITKVLPFRAFKPSIEQVTNYYYKNPDKPFCKSFIHPKLTLLLQKFSVHVNYCKINLKEPFYPIK